MIEPTQDIQDSEYVQSIEAQRIKEQDMQAKLDSFGQALAKKRDEAIEGRSSSGIEQEWLEDEDSYQGIDDANRDSAPKKPKSSSGSIITSRPKDVRSSVFMNITRPYVDAGAAKVSDMLLPTDDANWAIRPTPVPELQDRKADQTQMVHQTGQPMVKQGPVDPSTGQPTQAPYTVADHVAEIMSKAKDQAKAAELRITDWLVECQYHAEVRKVIEDCARLGVGILKGPIPVKKRNKRVQKMQGMTAIIMEDSITPASVRVDPWKLYPDPSCGEDIHNGSYIWERDDITGRKLRELRGLPGYIDAQIDAVLQEGPGKKYDTGAAKANDLERYEIWYYYGFADSEDMAAAGVKLPELDQIPAMVVMVNDRVIKAALSPQESGEFPYDVMPWQRRTDHWAGVGVARQVRTPQRMLNAATRNMMDNAGMSAGPQLVVRRGVVEPADNNWAMTPRKVWYVNDDGDSRSVNDVFAAINIPTLQNELMAIIQYAQKMAEDVTGLPMLLQGQQGSAPETVGGMTMMNNNASTVLRRIARTFDDKITEPHIRRYYEWLLTYGEDEAEKGDFTIDARGSTALVERDIQNQIIGQMANVVANPMFGLNPTKWAVEWLKSQRLDPKAFEFSDEEKQQMQQQQAQQQPDPNAARAQATVQVAQMRMETEQGLAQQQAELAQSEMQFKRELADRDHQARMAELQVTERIEMMKLAAQQRTSLDKIKAQLADRSLVERNKRELFAAEAQLKQQQGSGI